MEVEVVVLAAGDGKRMRSRLPKVLHEVAGRPLLAWALDGARSLAPAAIHVVYRHERVRAVVEASRAREAADAGEAREAGEAPPAPPLRWVEQERPRGTGHALAQALPGVAGGRWVAVLYGDVPGLGADLLRRLAGAAGPRRLALVTVALERPDGYGRILRDEAGRVAGIVEHRDASPAERAIREVNTGILAAPAEALRGWVAALTADNAQGEYYLTDVVAMAASDGFEVVAVAPESADEVLGINDRVELEAAERLARRRRAEALMRAGVTLRDASRIDVRGQVEADEDVTIDVDVVLEGRVRLGRGVVVGPFSLLRDADIGDGAEVLSHCIVDGARVAPGARIGPFARLRPGTEIGAEARVGNFVEVKASRLGRGSKANHLSYVGDAEVGRDVNIGAGTITCNFDGAGKHRTVIGDGAFIGSGVELVAPVEVGAGATVGAGSTLSRDAPPGQLTLTRSRQTTVARWKRRTGAGESAAARSTPEDGGGSSGSADGGGSGRGSADGGGDDCGGTDAGGG